jgi:hypothetical protein
VSVGSLFEEPESLLVRASERPPIEFGGEGIDDFLLTPLKGSRMQAIEPHAARRQRRCRSLFIAGG